MTLEQLKVFLAVAEREHMTAAAQAMNMTQSAVSSAIAALEGRHGVKLFHRVGRGICLTEAGRLFAVEARAVLARADAAEQALASLSGLHYGTLKIVASQTIAGYWLPAVLAAFRGRYPRIAVEVLVGNTEQAAQHVLDGRVDLGIVEGQVNEPALASWPVGEDRLVLVQNTATTETIDALWLSKARWVMRESGSGTRSSLDRALMQQGVVPESLDISLVLPSNESVRTAVEAGGGVAALSFFVVEHALKAGRLHALPYNLGVRPFYGLRHKERYRSAAAEALLKML
ncbi:LysR family transcriptional regulator [Neokomagataea thailandica NBRC 106555]|uniref:LysR family transcriptional regulator n=2 Tax=Neokomagataea TaxID=1223423 RepID=A0A4Y6V6R5_9PROT|nr:MULTISPECIES: LysR family transcriptional regulator [Neokomagataea]QDH25074.1 LysR family transcriptional regulator [Neokomagataea tanensis]GBR54151.1 LysR family transcriptional regulator [Neokomagataea thailandica NBRC 106555]